jgi:hypothetical protein
MHALQLPRLAPLLCVRPSARGACSTSSSSLLSLSSSWSPPRSTAAPLRRLISTPRRTAMYTTRAARTTTTASAASDAYNARLNADWQRHFDELRAYASSHGGSPDVPTKSNDPALKQLGTWVRTQRNKHNNGELRQDRVDALNTVDFDWDPLSKQWIRIYERLKTYAAAHGGSAEVARNDDESLAQWLVDQRRHARENKLCPERMAMLQALGVTPDKMAAAHARSRVQSNEAAWRAMLEQLRTFVSEHGHADVPFAHVQDGKKLGAWMFRQRQHTLSPEHAAQLASLGFHFDGQHRGGKNPAILDAAWNERVEELAAYKEATGSVLVPCSTNVGGKRMHNSLGSWLCDQRSAWRVGELSPERVAKLQALGVTPDRLRL